jgi:hypothetical protein
VRRRPSPLVAFALLASLAAAGCGPGRDAGTGADTAAGDVAVPDTRPAGFAEIALIEKNASLQPLPPRGGGPRGAFWYRATGDSLAWMVRASGLPPGRAFRVLLKVDGVPYAITSRASDGSGALRASGALDRFADGTCAGDAPPPRPIAGTHALGVIVEDDGADPGSTARSGSPLGPSGNTLTCSGNGDGVFTPRLYEAAEVLLTS